MGDLELQHHFSTSPVGHPPRRWGICTGNRANSEAGVRTPLPPPPPFPNLWLTNHNKFASPGKNSVGVRNLPQVFLAVAKKKKKKSSATNPAIVAPACWLPVFGSPLRSLLYRQPTRINISHNPQSAGIEAGGVGGWVREAERGEAGGGKKINWSRAFSIKGAGGGGGGGNGPVKADE